jgi:hypothetical protein
MTGRTVTGLAARCVAVLTRCWMRCDRFLRTSSARFAADDPSLALPLPANLIASS